jgi:hypothetical protein
VLNRTPAFSEIYRFKYSALKNVFIIKSEIEIQESEMVGKRIFL